MKFHLEINMDNDAFGDDPQGELSQILMIFAERMAVRQIMGSQGRFSDSNGNFCGKWEIEG